MPAVVAAVVDEPATPIVISSTYILDNVVVGLTKNFVIFGISEAVIVFDVPSVAYRVFPTTEIVCTVELITPFVSVPDQ